MKSIRRRYQLWRFRRWQQQYLKDRRELFG